MDPAKYVTSGNKSPGLAESSKPAVQDFAATEKTDDYRLPGHAFSHNISKITPRKLTDKQNRTISFESKHNPTANESMESVATPVNGSSSTINDESKKSRNVTRMENDDRVF